MKILFVDDDENVRVSMVRCLEADGHEVVQASNGAQALDRLTQTQFDVVISDLDMPVIDGAELLRACQEVLPGLPVIIYTGNDNAKQSLLDRGAKFVLLKSLQTAQTLLDVLNNLENDVADK